MEDFAEYEPEDGVFVGELSEPLALREYAKDLMESTNNLSEPEKRLVFAEHLINEGYSFRTDGDRFVVLKSPEKEKDGPPSN